MELLREIAQMDEHELGYFAAALLAECNAALIAQCEVEIITKPGKIESAHAGESDP